MIGIFRMLQRCRLLPVLVACFAALSCAGQPLPADKPHHKGDGFQNPGAEEDRSRFGDFLKWRWQRLWKNMPQPEPGSFPRAGNDAAFLRANHDRTTLTWIGHATVLLQIGGKNILTDPIFSKRASPVSWAGPKRLTPPGLAMDDLPPIDLVVISHDHYDSLDARSVKGLLKREGGEKTLFVVPPGLKVWMQKRGVKRVVELDWWEQHQEDNLTVVAVPVRHWSKRGLSSRNRTLWAGWVVRTEGFRFFFAGDSGYAPLFKEIGRRLGPFDLSAIPIGAYAPRWFMKRHHMTPEEAVQVHLDTGSRKSVAIHWGTFNLTDEPMEEPPRRLKEAIQAKALSPDEFLVLKHGETIVLDAP